MNIVIISASLRPDSRSRILAQYAEQQLTNMAGVSTQWVDLRDYPLPLCDGNEAYNHQNVATLSTIISAADVILVAVPVYNYDINAAVKNLLELTGSAWENKIAGFLCAAGGRTSYMAVMSFANDLMLDFRTLIIPRFVYATDADFESENGNLTIKTPEIRQRIQELTTAAVSLGKALLTHA